MKISVLADTLASLNKNQIGVLISFMRSSHKNGKYEFPYDKWEFVHSSQVDVMKSSIRGKQYLAYLWELGELPAYIISGFDVLWESEVR